VSRTVDSSSSGVRGVRGTRASMRARGVATGIARGVIVFSFLFLLRTWCSFFETRRHNHYFGSRKDQYPSAFVLDINSDKYDSITRPWTGLSQPASIRDTDSLQVKGPRGYSGLVTKDTRFGTLSTKEGRQRSRPRWTAVTGRVGRLPVSLNRMSGESVLETYPTCSH